jgi:hypothetical protein
MGAKKKTNVVLSVFNFSMVAPKSKNSTESSIKTTRIKTTRIKIYIMLTNPRKQQTERHRITAKYFRRSILKRSRQMFWYLYRF